MEDMKYTPDYQTTNGTSATSWALKQAEERALNRAGEDLTMEEAYRLAFVRKGRNGDGLKDGLGNGMWREGRRFDFSR